MTEEQNVNDQVNKRTSEIGTKNQDKNGFNINTLLNIICLIGLVILFVLYFSDDNKSKIKTTKTVLEKPVIRGNDNPSIVFINTDTLKEKYEFVQEFKRKLEKKYKMMDAEISSKQSELEERARKLQNKYELGLINQAEAQQMESELQMEAQKWYAKNETYSDEFADEEYKYNLMYIDTVLNFLQRYNRAYNYDYIFGYSKGSILYTKDSLEITNEVLKILNTEYEDRKAM